MVRILSGVPILLVALGFCLASRSPAADIHPPKGEAVKGEIVRIDDKEFVFKQGDKTVTKSIKELLKIDFRDIGKIDAKTPHAAIELTDGSILLTSKYLIKKKNVEMTLLGGQTVTVPLSAVANILNDARDEAARRDWRQRVINTKGREALVTKAGALDVTLGEGDEAGTKINFAINLEGMIETRLREIAPLTGLIFKNVPDAKAVAPVAKLFDVSQNVIQVATVSVNETDTVVTTPAGAKIEFKNDRVARLDYSKGRFEYLSELSPTKVVAKSNLDEGADPDQWHVYKNTSLNKTPLSVGGTTYANGLALKPYVELNYDLRGDFREFEAVVGIDDNVTAAGTAVLVVEGDGKELTRISIDSADKKRSRTVTLNVKDVQKLKVVVEAEGLFDTGVHLNLADAKVRKE